MTTFNASGTAGFLAFALLASPFAMADDTGWYGGLNAGQSRAKIDDQRITSGLLGSGFATSSIVDDNRGTGFKVFGGYQFNKNFALEGGYFDLGRFGYTATTVPAGTLNGTIRLKGLNLDTVGILPITEKLSAFGRVGVNYAEARDNFNGTGAVNIINASPSKREANIKFGVGLQYAFTDALNMRVEAERYRVNDAIGNRGDIDMVSVGLVYRFGDKSPTPVARAPEPVTYMPPPVAVVTPPPMPAPPPAPRKVSFSADSLFAFDRADLTPTGKQSLARFASELNGTDYDQIRVTGHTDRIGAHAYNLKLSSRRADAVKAELVTAAGIPTGKIVTAGVNGAEPVTKPGDCVGQKVSKALIACLQPDRRVDVEVSGTR
ncbi:outer membrane beta-barrel protein [Actimicrobium antarcticum]|uniref:Porin OmpA n=1 Tax=Actimicrobium antarcticum TaxID=1051899 RepID=A0ABP7SPZ4_9BURK